MTEDDTFKVLRRKVSYAIMKEIIRAVRLEYYTESYEILDREIRIKLKEYGWDYADFYVDGRHD